MKRKLLCKLLVLNTLSCSAPAEDRYTQQSQETDVLREFATHYSKGEWASIQALYADSAKIYNNQREKYQTPQEDVDEMAAFASNFSSCGFVQESIETEMVQTDKGEIWVNFWAVWEGTIASNGEKLEMPVHLTAQFVKGKIVKEHAYYNTSEIIEAMVAISVMQTDTTKTP